MNDTDDTIEVFISPFWFEDAASKAQIFIELLERDSPGLEKRTVDFYLDGQYSHWVATHFRSWIKPGVTLAALADHIGVHKAQLTRASKQGVLTLPVLFQLMRVLAINPEHLSPRPPDPVSVAAGFARSIAIVNEMLSHATLSGMRTGQHTAVERLCVADAALLYALIFDGLRLNQWLRACGRANGNLASILSQDCFQKLLVQCRDAAVSMVGTDPQALDGLAHWAGTEASSKGFARHLANLWNPYQLDCAIAMECVNSLILLPFSV